MNKRNRDKTPISPSEELIREGALAELRLLKLERSAEQKLGHAIAAREKIRVRLGKAQKRLERSNDAVNAAESALRGAQAKRAAGSEGVIQI